MSTANGGISSSTGTASGSKVTTKIKFVQEVTGSSSTPQRFVAVRYFLDRPGYGIANSSSRMWINPPAVCTTDDVLRFLVSQGILLDKSSLVVEVYLDKFHSYMLLDACESGGVAFDFSSTSQDEPGVLNVRLTDPDAGLEVQSNPAEALATAIPRNCNTSQIGLFAFSMTLALEMVSVTAEVSNGDRLQPSFVLTWGPYAFFVSGLLQLVVGMWEVTRNNVYGATAFSAFGCFWLANGTKLILTTYFPEQIPESLLGEDPWGAMVRNLWILLFIFALFIQTLNINKLSSALLVLLSICQLGASFAGFSSGMKWVQVIFGWTTSVFAFYVFLAEFTNEVYHRQVFNLYPWKEYSSLEAFGAAGRPNNLTMKATQLRTAHEAPITAQLKEAVGEKVPSFHGLRSAVPIMGSPVTAEKKAK